MDKSLNATPAADAPAAPRALQELAETVQRSRLGGPFYVLLWGLSGLAADLWQRAPIGFVAMGFVFAGFTWARFRTRSLPEGASAVAVARRLNAVWSVVLANAAVWGAAAAWLLFTTPEESARTVVAICSFAFSTAFAHNFCMRLHRTFAAVALLYLPTMIAFVAIGTRWEFVLVGVLYIVYVALAARRGHAEYLQRLDLEDELRHQRDLFRRQSERDSLTGLPNRRHFGAVLERWVADACENVRGDAPPFALLILDLDWFKAINDRHGHGVGDACLRAFADLLSTAFSRGGDVPARLGGEEFAVLMADCGLEQARGRAEDFRQSLAGRPLPLENIALGLTVSIGAGAFDPSRHDDAEAFYHEVDAALYEAKAAGRNRVRVAQPAE